MSKILIIGGTRYFGKRLTRLLLDREHEVTLLTRGQSPDEFGGSVQRIQMDRRELRSNHPLLKDKSWDLVYDQVCYDSCEAAGACESFRGKILKYVFTSTGSVYNTEGWHKESAFNPHTYDFEKPITQDVNYGEAKRQAEATFFKLADFPVAAVRFPIVLGEDDYTSRLKFHVDAILENKPVYFPNLDAKMSFVSSTDAAAFLAALSVNYKPGPINCCSIEPISLRNFISILEETLNKKANIVAEKNPGEHSPYGIENDWYMDTDRLLQYGFRPDPIHKWLPEMALSLRNER